MTTPGFTRWKAAVIAQFRIAVCIHEAPESADLSPELVKAIYDATIELQQAWNEAHRLGVAAPAAEYAQMWNIHRSALLEWNQRRRPVAIAQEVEQCRADAEAALALCQAGPVGLRW